MEQERGIFHNTISKSKKRQVFDTVAIFTTVFVTQAIIPSPLDYLLLPAGAAYWYWTQGHKQVPAVVERGLDVVYAKSEETFTRIFDYVLLSKRQREIVAEISDSKAPTRTEGVSGSPEMSEDEE